MYLLDALFHYRLTIGISFDPRLFAISRSSESRLVTELTTDGICFVSSYTEPINVLVTLTGVRGLKEENTVQARNGKVMFTSIHATN